jgi:dephospho-CoA kinase
MKRNDLKCVAITGGIGCGKSEIMKILREMGHVTVSCDRINAELLEEPSYIASIAELFPSAVSCGRADKRILAEIIFNDAKKRKKLNDLAHPIIRERLEAFIAKSGADVFAEVPLLNETDLDGLFTSVWVVKADLNKRAERIALRDKISIEFAKKKIASQSENHVYSVATDTINNDFCLESLKDRIRELIKTMR